MTPPAGTVVAAVDGSTSSDHALMWAATQAHLEHRPLTLVHALGPAHTDEVLFDPGNSRSALRQRGTEVIANARLLVQQKLPDLEIYDVLDARDPQEVLVELSEDAEVLVLGSRGRGPARSALLGSVGVALAGTASCPVVVHRPARAGLVRNGILVAADASAESQPVLEFAYQQAALRDLPLTVTHCYWELEDVADLQPVPASALITEDDARRQLSESTAGMGERYPGVHVTTTVVHGPPERHLPTLSQRSDLLVVGSHHWSRARRLVFFSVSTSLLEHASCPVAVVPVVAPSDQSQEHDLAQTAPPGRP